MGKWLKLGNGNIWKHSIVMAWREEGSAVRLHLNHHSYYFPKLLMEHYIRELLIGHGREFVK
jgi:hypothetical protein